MRRAKAPVVRAVLALLIVMPLAAQEPGEVAYLVARLETVGAASSSEQRDLDRRLIAIGPAALPALLAALDDEVARRVERDEQVAEAILDLDAEDAEVRESAQRTLKGARDDVVPLLDWMEAYGSPEAVARVEAVRKEMGWTSSMWQPDFLYQVTRIVAAIADDSCVGHLARIARHYQPVIRWTAVDGLVRLGNEEAHRRLREVALEAPPFARWDARLGLLRLGDDSTMGTAEEFMQDWPQPYTRYQTYRLLRLWESPEAVTLAARAFVCDDAYSSEALRYLVGVMDDRVLTSAVLEVLDPCPTDRLPSFLRLLVTNAPGVEPALRSALDSTDPKVRAAAVTSYAIARGAFAIPSCERMLDDPDPDVRQAALEALLAYGGPTSGPFGQDKATGRAAVSLLANDLYTATPEERARRAREAISSPEPEVRNAALAWAVLFDVPGLEDVFLPLLAGSPGETDRRANAYLEPRRTPALLDRVRERALGPDPGGAPALWVAWEPQEAMRALMRAAVEEGNPALGHVDVRCPDAQVASDYSCLILEDRGYHGVQGTEETDPVRRREQAARDPEVLLGLWRDPDLRSHAARLLRLDPHLLIDYRAPVLREALGREAVPYILRVLAQPEEWSAEWSVESARALVHADPDEARRIGRRMASSLSWSRRSVALFVFFALGEEPPEEALHAIDHRQGWFLEETLRLAARQGTPGALRRVIPLLQDPRPEVARAAWDALAIGTAHLPDELQDGHVPPWRAVQGWLNWFAEHGRENRASLLKAALASRGLPDDADGRIRVCLTAPWYVSTAVVPEELISDLGYARDPHGMWWMAARWRASLR